MVWHLCLAVQHMTYLSCCSHHWWNIPQCADIHCLSSISVQQTSVNVNECHFFLHGWIQLHTCFIHISVSDAILSGCTSVVMQQNAMEYWQEGSTSTAIPPLSPSAAAPLREWWLTGIGFPERLWMPHLWRHSVQGWLCLWAAWSSGRWPCPWQGAWDPFQSISFYDSMKTCLLY